MEVIMKVGHLFLCFLVAFLMAAAAVKAEDIDAVILATNSNYPDTLVAAVAAEKIGAPLLLTERGQLSSETKSEIESLGVSTVYIVGGPAVVAENIEEELGEDYVVVRLWGMTRYGTAVEVANYFWDESDKAVLVWDSLVKPALGNSEMVSQAKEMAIEEEIPLLLINKNYIPTPVEGVLESLGVQEVVLIGNVGGDVGASLDNLGITVAEEIKGPTPNETRRLLKEKLKQRIKARIVSHGKRPLVVVAVGNWTDTIKAPHMPNGTSRHITSEDQIDDLIAEINENNYTRIVVVGKPALAKVIHDRLTEAGISSTLLSGRPVAVARQIVQREIAAIRKRAQLAVATLRNLFVRRIRAMNLTESGLEKIESVRSILDKAGTADKTAVLAGVRAIRDEMLEKLNEGDNEGAWLLHKKLESSVAGLIYKHRATSMLVPLYRNLTNLETKYRISQKADVAPPLATP